MGGFEILQVIDNGNSLGFDSSEEVVLDRVRTFKWSVSIHIGKMTGSHTSYRTRP
jgi:hypothetical protein